MSMWAEEDEPKRHYTAFALRCALRLWAKVRRDHKLKIRWKAASVEEWAMHFDRLIRVDGRTKKDVRKVLDAHLANMSNPYWPAAYCGAKFRENFERIADAMDRMVNRAKRKDSKEDHFL